MEEVIKVTPRTPSKKGGARKLRAQGMIPGILYRKGSEAHAFSVDPAEIRKKLMMSGLGRNTVLRVSGLDADALALLKDAQIDPVNRALIHIDLIEVREDDMVEVEVPLEFAGKSKGVVDGGILQAARRFLRVKSKPLAIPEKISIDVTPLEVGQSFHVRDVKLPEGITSADPEHFAVVSVVAPAAEEAPKVEEVAAAAAGAVPEGAAPETKEKAKEKAD